MTFDFQPITLLAEMGGVLDLAPLVRTYADFIPHLYEMQGTEMIWWNRDPVSGSLYGFTGRHFAADLRMATFVREDWLNALNLAPPTTMDEFEAMLVAFRDNAELLLGSDANQMIPFQLSQDVGWRGDPILTSFISSDITHRDWYIYGYDDRRFMYPEIREGARILNRWYNDGLIWQDFSLHDANNPLGNDLIKLGFVGSFVGNWDMPFRTSDRLIVDMRENVGPEANFIAVAPFPNDSGRQRMEVSHGQERHIFFPHTNTNPIASLIYIDFVSRPEIREFLMFGYEGIHFERAPEGHLVAIDNELWPDNMFIPSLRNFDLLPTFTNIPPLRNPDLASLATSFEGIEQENVNNTIELTRSHAWIPPRVIIRDIAAEGQFGGGLDGMFGMGNEVLNQAINASVADFDSVFDAGLARYMAAGGQAIIDERRAAWLETFGDVDWLPQ
jgi:putative aldouronate transport system substrate-binding protein